MINRSFSKPLTALLLRTPLTPNQATLLSLLFGILSGVFFARGNYVASLYGAVLFQIASVLDNCDGNIARAKNMSSKFGSWLDVGADLFVDFSLFIGLTIGLLKQNIQGPVTLVGELCILGSIINFIIVCVEKLKGFGPAVFNRPNPAGSNRESFVHEILDGVREGDSSWFIFLFAVLGKTDWLLWASGIYMQAIWISAIAMNYRWIFVRKGRV